MKVSVIIPHVPGTRPEFLAQAVKSVHGQTHKNWELIVVEKQQGMNLNINDGLKQASGDLVKILHDDDYLTNKSMQWAVKYIGDNDFVHGNVIKHWHPSGREVYIEPKTKIMNFRDLLESNPINVASVYYRREALNYIGGWSMISNELATHLELLFCHRRLGYINRPMSYYRVHEGQSGNSEWYKKHGQKVRREMIQHFKDRIGI